MTIDEVLEALQAGRPELVAVESGGDSFVFYDPEGAAENRMVPFATIVTSDAHDTASQLSRPVAFRFNVGIGRDAFKERFGPVPAPCPDWGVIDSGYDYSATDVLMPHPVYAPMGWACVVNPSRRTWDDLEPLVQGPTSERRGHMPPSGRAVVEPETVPGNGRARGRSRKWPRSNCNA